MSPQIEPNEKPPTVKQAVPSSKSYNRRLIQVTQDDIDKSCRADAGACMNVRAIKRQISEAKNIHVDIATTRWTNKYTGDRYTFLTPGPAQKAIIPYDLGLKMPPYSFYLKQLIQITPKSVIARRPPRLAIDSHKGTDKKHRDHPTVLVGGKAMPEAGPRKGFV